jgi:hypothetical protein
VTTNIANNKNNRFIPTAAAVASYIESNVSSSTVVSSGDKSKPGIVAVDPASSESISNANPYYTVPTVKKVQAMIDASTGGALPYASSY